MMDRTIAGARLLSASIAAIDLVLIRFWVLGGLSTPDVLALHGAAAALVCGIAFALWPRERMRTTGALLMALLLGPVGGVALLIADLGRGGALSPAARPRPQAAAPSRAELLHAEIVQGRRRPVGAQAPRPFAEVFASGALARQQDAIAAISLHYRPELLPALRLALASEVPALRVQAAAVFAKLRGRFDERTKVVRAAVADGRFTPEMAAEAATIAASGFADGDTATEFRAHAARATAAPVAAPPRRREDGLVRPPRLKRHACGGLA